MVSQVGKTTAQSNVTANGESKITHQSAILFQLFTFTHHSLSSIFSSSFMYFSCTAATVDFELREAQN